MNNYIVELENVIKIYLRGIEKIYAANELSFSIQESEFISIVGPSGSGKSTLLNLIGCVDKATAGTVRIDGIETSKLKEKELAKIRSKKIGFVFQQFFLLSTLTALENVELPTLFLRINTEIQKHKNTRDKTKKAIELLELVGLSGRENHLPSQLSGGEMQRVAIARALINEPKLLLADEPTGNLDSKNSETIFEIFQKLNKNGLTVIIVTHNLEFAKRTQKIIYLQDGKII